MYLLVKDTHKHIQLRFQRTISFHQNTECQLGEMVFKEPANLKMERDWWWQSCFGETWTAHAKYIQSPALFFSPFLISTEKWNHKTVWIRKQTVSLLVICSISPLLVPWLRIICVHSQCLISYQFKSISSTYFCIAVGYIELRLKNNIHNSLIAVRFPLIWIPEVNPASQWQGRIIHLLKWPCLSSRPWWSI